MRDPHERSKKMHQLAFEFEHGFVSQVSPLPPEWNSLSPERVGDFLARTLTEISHGLDRSLSALDGGGWEVVSHNTTITSSALIATFLIRRRAQFDHS